MRNLWGARFYNPKTRKFTNKNKSKKLKRGFVQFIMDPLYQVFDTVMTEKKRISKKTGKEVLACFKLFKQLGIKLKKDEMDFRQKVLLKRAMQRWLPAAEALMEMLVIHLPSPAKAQTYVVFECEAREFLFILSLSHTDRNSRSKNTTDRTQVPNGALVHRSSGR